MATDVKYLISLQDEFSGKMNTINKSTQSFDKSLGRTIGRFASFAAVGAVVGNMVKTIANFEEQVSNLSAITGATGEDLEFLKKKAIELGGATTKSSIDTIKAFKLIASAKPELLDNAAALADVTKEAITLSEASGLELPQAATAVTDALNQFGLSADQSSRVINVLAAGSKFAAAEIPDLTTSLKEFGGVSESLNISLEESAAAVETLSTKGLKGARAGINLRNVFLKLGAGVDKYNPKVVGLSKALDNLSEIQDDTTELTKMFGRQNVLAAQTLIKQRDRVDELTKSLTGTNIAYEQAAINTDNLNSDFKRLGSSWEKFTLNLNKGEGRISGFLRKGTQLLTDFIDMLDFANKSAAEIEKQVQLEILSESAKDDINEFESFLKKLQVSPDNIKQVEKLAESFLDVDVQRLKRLKESENAEEYQIKLLEGRIKAIKDYVEIQKKAKVTNLSKPVVEGMDKVEDQVTRITSAAPKTFNINIQKLVENFTVSSETIKESAGETRDFFVEQLTLMLADVQAIS
jgi:TP901 family phage tail tape measure protein